MDSKKKLENKLSELLSKQEMLYILLDRLWEYHPSNPNFVNPITSYEITKEQLLDLEKEIKRVEFQINTLN